MRERGMRFELLKPWEIEHAESHSLRSHLNKPCDVLGWIFPFPLPVGIVGGCGSLADLWTNAGARLLLCFAPAGAVPGIISMLELSLDELSVCWSKLRINLMSPAIECSNEDTCRDS